MLLAFEEMFLKFSTAKSHSFLNKLLSLTSFPGQRLQKGSFEGLNFAVYGQPFGADRGCQLEDQEWDAERKGII
jgi:hypothetical protein